MKFCDSRSCAAGTEKVYGGHSSRLTTLGYNHRNRPNTTTGRKQTAQILFGDLERYVFDMYSRLVGSVHVHPFGFCAAAVITIIITNIIITIIII